MIIEHAVLSVTPGREVEFEAAMTEALPLIESAPGCLGATVRREVENPTHYLLLVQWATVSDHVEGFRQSPAFERWRSLTHHFYDERPVVTHFESPLPRE